eukprot:758773-Pyramimonas_sp.AAC.1
MFATRALSLCGWALETASDACVMTTLEQLKGWQQRHARDARVAVGPIMQVGTCARWRHPSAPPKQISNACNNMLSEL